MISPRHRLLFWFALVVLPFSGVAAVYPDAAVFAFVFIALLFVVAVADVMLSRGRLSGITVELPPLTRLARDRPGTITVTVTHPARESRPLRLGLSLPPELRAAKEDIRILLPAGTGSLLVEWPCIPTQRGNYRIEFAGLETVSRLGFWAIRGRVPLRGEVRVYPNLLAERRHLAALFLNRGSFGLHAQRQVGKGRDFEKLRDYTPGDSYEDIHWKTTAKRGHPVTKVFQIEKTQEIYVILDASRLSGRPLAAPSTTLLAADGLPREVEQTTLERFITSALVLGLAAEKQGDLFGLITFSDQVETFVRARNGRAHFSACRDALYTLQPRPVTPDFDEIASFIRLRLRRRSLLVILTALDDPVLAEGFVRHMDLLCRQHLVLVSMLKPAGADPLFHHDHDIEELDDLYRHLGGHLRWHDLRELEKILRRRGVTFSLLDNERMSAEIVSQYLNVKRRQLL